MSDNQNNTPESQRVSVDAAPQAPVETFVDAEAPLYQPPPPDPRVTLTHDMLIREERPGHDPLICMPPGDWDAMTGVMSRLPRDVEEFRAPREWLEHIANDSAWETLYGAKTALSEFPHRQEAQWQQIIDSKNGPLAMGRNKPHIVEGGRTLSGKAGVSRIRSSLGLGDRVSIPLWHSGYWVTFNRPSDAAVIDFETEIMNETVAIGRQTNGAAFSNTSVIHNRKLVDFAFEHLHETSLQDRDRCLQLASVNDLQAIALGMAMAIYPNGFDFVRPVMGATLDDLKVIRGRCRPDKMWLADRASFSEKHLHQMTRRASGSITIEEAKTFTATLTTMGQRLFPLDDDSELKVTFGQPTIEDHLTSGDRWVGQISLMAERAFAKEGEENKRARYVSAQAKASFLLQYSHWVKAIHIGEDVIEDRETIENSLAEMCSADQIHESFVKAVNEYIRESLVAVAGVRAVNEAEEGKLPRHPRIIPIDPMSTFFRLVVRRADKIQNRG